MYQIISIRLVSLLIRAIKFTADAEMASPNTIRRALRELINTNNLANRQLFDGRKNNSNSNARIPTDQEADLICSELEAVRTNGYHSLTTLAAELGDRLNCNVGKKVLWNWLHFLGYTYESKRFIGSLDPSFKRNMIRSYIFSLAAATREEKQGTRVLVYMDESYIHTAHNVKQFWCSTGSCSGAVQVVVLVVM